jgi:hypothetical protein
MVVGVWLSDERVSHCGGQLGMQDFSIPPRPPAPVPKYGADVDDDTMVSWTGEGRVFELRLGPSSSSGIRIYTTKHSFSWDDFVALGFEEREFLQVSFSRDGSRKTNPIVEVVTVSALYPYESMDDLTAGRGAMATGTSWQKVPSRRDDFPSERGHVAVPASVAKRLPVIKEPEFKAFDPLQLPVCATTVGATMVGAIRPAMVETLVSLRGMLAFNGWSCTMKGCYCCNSCGSEWIIKDPNVPGSEMVLQRGGFAFGLGANECQIPKPPQIEVIATGRLMRSLGEVGPVHSHPFFLDDVSLCSLKPAAGR